MSAFWVVMVKRRDGKLYADLHKTNGQMYLTREDADKTLSLMEDTERPSWHVVEMVASLPGENE